MDSIKPPVRHYKLYCIVQYYVAGSDRLWCGGGGGLWQQFLNLYLGLLGLAACHHQHWAATPQWTQDDPVLWVNQQAK